MSRLFSACVLTMILWTGLPAAAAPSPSFNGPLGLNTVPDARMDESGTVRLHTGTLDPYAYAGVGIQIAQPFYIGIRQTAEMSSLRDDPIRLYPGIDMKLRLLKESDYAPAITVGLNGAVGHKRMASEYLALSKRYRNFDFTGGIGWGRMGSAGHVKNPLRFLGGHFGKRRALDGELPSGPPEWFTGKSVGFFGGFSYDMPWIDGLIFKADWNADDYLAERGIRGFDVPAHWSAGLNYAPREWINLGVGMAGADKVMATLNLQTALARWPWRTGHTEKPVPLRSYRTGPGFPLEMEKSARDEGLRLYDIRADGATAWAQVDADPFGAPTPQYIGRAARHVANHAGEGIEQIDITPALFGLRGPTVSLMRGDLERALAQRQGSPQEIWRNAHLNAAPPAGLEDRYLLPVLAALDETKPFKATFYSRLLLDTQTSLNEEDSGVLYRTSLLGEWQRKMSPHTMAGFSLRLNLKDNLSRLRKLRPATLQPVRSDVDRFASDRAGIERLYTGWTTSFTPSFHLALTAGWLEEMYNGTAAEILYRPFGKTFALGLDSATVFRRDPGTAFNLGLVSPAIQTAHINAWYEPPGSEVTFQAQIGRYLAEDVGGSLSMTRRFDSGAAVKAFVTATDQADPDPFGGLSHVYGGVQFNLPLGGFRTGPVNHNMGVRLTAAQLGRESGQSLDLPMPLYEITEPLSYRHLTRRWTEIVE